MVGREVFEMICYNKKKKCLFISLMDCWLKAGCIRNIQVKVYMIEHQADNSADSPPDYLPSCQKLHSSDRNSFGISYSIS